MTEMESRATYGMLSKSILNNLATNNVSSGEIFLFSLHMQWGIVLGHPHDPKSVIAAEMLQRLTEMIQDEKRASQDDLKNIFNENRDGFLQIFKQISTRPHKPSLAWYLTWKEHCNLLLTKDPTPDNCFQLFWILRECMDLRRDEFLLSLTIIHETLLCAAAN